MKANHNKRAEVVKAMDLLVSCINNEEIIESWLMCGVADGDITKDTSLQDIIDLGYTEDKCFGELMNLFTRMMYEANTDGGLYCNGITSGRY